MKIAGRAKFDKQLKALPELMKAEIRKALQTSGEEMVDAAKRFVPVKSGNLRNSIGYTVGAHTPENANVRGVSTGSSSPARDAKADDGLLVTVHAGDARAWYAALVEFGTSPHENKGKFEGSQHPGTDASPFFYPAYRLTKKRAASRIQRATRAGAKKAFGK